MINDELLLDEALRRNEINQQCQQPHDEISPPEQFQTKAEESVESQHSPIRKPFSRSVSIGGGGRPRQMASIADNMRSNASPRKRNSSYETSSAAGDDLEQISDSLGPGDFLSNPSPALQNLFGSSSSAWSSGMHYAVSADILQRPVMSFVLQWNDLESLQIAMTMALRKSACRTFAMQGCNYLGFVYYGQGLHFTSMKLSNRGLR